MKPLEDDWGRLPRKVKKDLLGKTHGHRWTTARERRHRRYWRWFDACDRAFSGDGPLWRDCGQLLTDIKAFTVRAEERQAS